MKTWIIGVDEAGRGPLAGPVAVGAVLVKEDFDWSLLPGVNDSKQLSEKKREELFLAARKLKAFGQLNYAVSMVSASVIDKVGIVKAIKLAMDRALTKIEKGFMANKHLINPRARTDLAHRVLVKLDGGLKAPERFVQQETIIKGDSKEKIIGLASIMAKVTRDKYMIKQSDSLEYQVYDFAKHKGYGTKLHRKAISEHGLSGEHRASFCRNI